MKLSKDSRNFFLFLQQILVEALHTPLKISIIRRPRAIEGEKNWLLIRYTLDPFLKIIKVQPKYFNTNF